MASAETDTELVVLNVVDEPTEVRLVASDTNGLTLEAPPISIAPFTAWRGSLLKTMPRVRRLLAPSGGIEASRSTARIASSRTTASTRTEGR